MKHPLLKASFISGILSLLAFAVEGLCAFLTESMPLSLPVTGGECTEYIGIGWKITTIYPCVPSDDPIQSFSTVSFHPLTLIVFFLLVLAAVRLIEAVKDHI